MLRIADGRGGREITIGAAGDVMPAAWSPDGRTLLYLAERSGGGNLFAVTPGGADPPVALVPPGGHVFQAQMSPDGRWIAYAADDRGSREIYVQPYPADGRRWIVSSDGGDQPRWRADGREIVYVASNRALTAVDVQFQPVFAAAAPRRLFTVRLPGANPGVYQFAMTPDADRFLLDAIAAPEPGVPVRVAVNWRGAVASVDSR
jgi:dipeptidyl aminopeptidase/acylaminoacyl peptidase